MAFAQTVVVTSEEEESGEHGRSSSRLGSPNELQFLLFFTLKKKTTFFVT